MAFQKTKNTQMNRVILFNINIICIYHNTFREADIVLLLSSFGSYYNQLKQMQGSQVASVPYDRLKVV